MRRFTATLRGRLFASHLAVVAIGVTVLLIAGRSLGPVFVHNHLESMGAMMGGFGQAESDQLETGLNIAFNRALLWAALASGATAIVAAGFAAFRVLQPLEAVRRVARRLATGSYNERVPLPRETELAALATDVNALAQALEETEARRLQLVGEVAHELRTPIATLKGYLEGILDGVFPADSETLTAAIHEAGRMERLSVDLSALSKAEDGRIDLTFANVDLSQLVTEVAERLRPQFVDQAVGLELDTTQTSTVTVDRDRLAQVLTNLIGNALTYTQTGGRVSIQTLIQSGMAQVEVTDTGRGLTTDQLAMVFERFYRVDRAAVGGTGIGLTIARSLARLHGGDVIATSPGLERGSTFRLTIPA